MAVEYQDPAQVTSFHSLDELTNSRRLRPLFSFALAGRSPSIDCDAFIILWFLVQRHRSHLLGCEIDGVS